MILRETTLRKEVYAFRKQLEARFDWRNHPYCFHGTCYNVSNILRYYLVNKGFEGKHFVLGGVYVQPSKQYNEFYIADTYSDKEYNHIVLVDLEGKLCIDITRDQFFPFNEKYYRVIIESLSNNITLLTKEKIYPEREYEEEMSESIKFNIKRRHFNYISCKQSYLNSHTEPIMIYIKDFYLPRILNGNIVEDIEGIAELENYNMHHRLRVFYEKGLRCVQCGKEGKTLIHSRDIGGNRHIDVFTETFELMTIDHILPKSKGGRTYIDNLQPMCQSCNSRKGDNI